MRKDTYQQMKGTTVENAHQHTPEPSMMPMTLPEIASAVGGQLIAPRAADATSIPDEAVALHVTSDSRQVEPGTVFVAIAGEHVDGHNYVVSAGTSGAVAAIVEHEIDNAPITQILVHNSVEALGLLAKHNLERRRELADPFSIIGITGSVGKTTTKDLLKTLLGEMGPTVAPVGSFNNEIGLPLTALHVGPATRFLVAEMGANHVGEIAKLTTIAPPDVAVVLKVGSAHLGEFGSVERIAQAKSEIVRGEMPQGVTVLNADDAHVAAMDRLAPSFVKWFGIERAEDHEDWMSADDITLDDFGRASFILRTSEGAQEHVTLGIPGRHNVMNALAAASVAAYFGMALRQIAHALDSVRRISPHRMAVSTVDRDGEHFTLIDDSFNANPDSMRAGIDGLKAWHADDEPEPFRVAVLGAMLELGGDEAQLHESIGAYAVDAGLDAIVAVGSEQDPHLDMLAGKLAQGATAQAESQHAGGPGIPVHWAHSAAQADEAIRSLAATHADMTVLLKGSHASGLSALADRWEDERNAN